MSLSIAELNAPPPPEYVLAGENKDRVMYNQLTPLQWMTGFCRSMKEESNVQIKEHMLDYVINLLEDANDFSWASAKASHAVLLCQMEQGKVVGWSDVEKIDRIRRADAQRHISQQFTQGKPHEKNGKQPTKFVAYVYFNINMCSQTKHHEIKIVYYRHICAACWEMGGKVYSHSQMDCRRSKTKNE